MTGDNESIPIKISSLGKGNKELEILLANKKGDEVVLSQREYQCLEVLHDQYQKIGNLIWWATLAEECQSSEKSVKTWCEEKGIPRQKYYYWRRKVLSFLSTSSQNT